jgi:hypothetical protein
MLKLKIRLPACQGVAPFMERRPKSFLQRQSTKDDTEMGKASVFAETSMNTICHTEPVEVSHDKRNLHTSTGFRPFQWAAHNWKVSMRYHNPRHDLPKPSVQIAKIALMICLPHSYVVCITLQCAVYHIAMCWSSHSYVVFMTLLCGVYYIAMWWKNNRDNCTESYGRVWWIDGMIFWLMR